MTEFLYSAFLPSIDQTISIKELKFDDYKQLVKLIHNDDNRCITDAFNKLIDSLVIKKDTEFTFLDKLIILLTIRSVCVFPVLELSFTDPKTNQLQKFTFEISSIVDSISDPEVFQNLNNKNINYGKIQVTYGIPNELYYNTEHEAIISTIKKIVINKKDATNVIDKILPSLPATILKDAKHHIKNIEENINKLSLLSIRTDGIEKKHIEYNPSIITDTTLEFLKLCFKKELTSLYELEYFLTSKLNMSYESVNKSTLAELSIYIGFFNEEKKEKERENRQQGYINPLAAR